VKTAARGAHAERSVIVFAMDPLTWAVFASSSLEADTVLGRIRRDGDRFRVGLDGDELEPYSFATLRESEGWFAEYAFAMTLGRRRPAGTPS
jgi:hypothetical protein